MGSRPNHQRFRYGPTRWVALLLAGAIAVSLPLALAVRAAGSVLFAPRTVTTIFSDHLIDSGLLRQLVIQGMFSRETNGQLTASDFGRLMTYADDQQRQAAADIVVPPDWAQTQLERLITDFFAWLNGDGVAPELTVELVPIRQGLLDGGAADLIDLIWSTWPACTAEQQAQIDSALRSGATPPLVACRPSKPTAGLYRQLIVVGLENEVQSMPATLAVIDLSAPGSADEFQQAKRLLINLRLLANWLWLVPASLLGVIVALVVRSWPGLFRWWGISLLAGGLVGTALAALGATIGATWLDANLVSSAGSLPIALHDAISGIARQGYQTAISAFFRQSIIESGAAGVLTLLGVLVRPDSDQRIPGEPAHVELDNASEPEAHGDESRPSGMFG